jgi:hypothetical protein
MADNLVRFPTIKVGDFIKEELLQTLDDHKDIDTGILLLQSGEDISIFCSKYSIELVGALEILKAKIMAEILIEEEDE